MNDTSVRTFQVESRFPGGQRVFRVWTPLSYWRDSDREYPVLYLLDGESHLGHTVAASSLLTDRRKMPEVIIVALPNASPAARARDFEPKAPTEDSTASGGADQFAAFLQHEVIPHVERNYRTEPFRMLVGHSWTGHFVVKSWLEWPERFQAHIAFSPVLWVDSDSLVERAEKKFAAGLDRPEFLWMNLGGREEEVMATGFNRLRSLLYERSPAALRCHAEVAKDESHDTTPLIGIYQGLRRLYTNFALPETFGEEHGPSVLENHFSSLSAELGYPMRPERALLDGLGQAYLQQGNLPFAIEAFELNAGYYPGIPDVYVSLAAGYERAGRSGDAEDMRRRAAQLMAGEDAFASGVTSVSHQDR